MNNIETKTKKPILKQSYENNPDVQRWLQDQAQHRQRRRRRAPSRARRTVTTPAPRAGRAPPGAPLS